MKRNILFFILFSCVITKNNFIFAQQIKILFDAKKAESAGNADWVIDADQNNLTWNPGPIIFGTNNYESNAQRIPTPAQSGITASTPETYWKGALSSWGIDCAKRNYTVESLPYNGSITYNNSSNPQDLSNYKVYIVCEPNIIFTDAEKTAIINFVKNGGGLFMVSDHNVSDRNGDSWDSPNIWNNMADTNSVLLNPFGIKFNLDDFSETSTSVSSSISDSIIHGPMGTVSKVKWTGGTSMTIDPAKNPSVRGAVFRSGATGDNSKVLVAYAHYGSGKVVAMADSSPADDSTGDVNDNLYNGYISDANGNHRTLIMNSTIWLATKDSIFIPAPNVSNNGPLCTGDSLLLNASTSQPNSTIQWTGPNGFSSTATHPKIYNVTTANAGTYGATVSSGGFTSAAGNTTVVINATPSVSLNASKTSICSGDSVVLTAGGAASYVWSPNGSGNSIVVYPSTTITYSVTGTQNGCSKSVSQLINVTPTPSTPVITEHTSNDTLFSSVTGTSYEWYKNGTPVATTSVPYYKPSSNGNYTLSITTNSCTSDVSAAFPFITTAVINNKSSDVSFNIFPNPSNGIFEISLLSKTNTKYNLLISDITGRCIFKDEINANAGSNLKEIVIPNFSTGIYLLSVSGNNGTASALIDLH